MEKYVHLVNAKIHIHTETFIKMLTFRRFATANA